MSLFVHVIDVVGAIRSPGTLTGLQQLPARCLQAPDRTNYPLSDLSTPELVLNGGSIERLILPQQDAKSLERTAKPILDVEAYRPPELGTLAVNSRGRGWIR